MLYNAFIFLGLVDNKGAFMKKGTQLEQIRQDVLSLLELDNLKLDIYTKKNLLKGIINNFFDYLKNL